MLSSISLRHVVQCSLPRLLSIPKAVSSSSFCIFSLWGNSFNFVRLSNSRQKLKRQFKKLLNSLRKLTIFTKLFQGSNPPSLVRDSAVLWRVHHVCDIVEQRSPCLRRPSQGGQRKVQNHYYQRCQRHSNLHQKPEVGPARLRLHSHICDWMYAQNARPWHVPSSWIIYEVSNDDMMIMMIMTMMMTWWIEFVMGGSDYFMLEVCIIWSCQIYHGDGDMEEKWKCQK